MHVSDSEREERDGGGRKSRSEGGRHRNNGVKSGGGR